MAFALLGLSVLEVGLLAWAASSGLRWMVVGVGPGPNHLLHGFCAVSLVCFVHCLAIFYFIGTGKDIKEGAAPLGDLAQEARRRVRSAQARVHPVATFTILLTVWAAVSGAMVFAGRLPSWVHFGSVMVAFLANLLAIPIEFGAMRANLELIRLVDGEVRRRRAGSAPSP